MYATVCQLLKQTWWLKMYNVHHTQIFKAKRSIRRFEWCPTISLTWSTKSNLRVNSKEKKWKKEATNSFAQIY